MICALVTGVQTCALPILKAVAVARVVLCCDGATARQFAAATDARLHFPSRSCWIDAADPDHCKNRTRRPFSLPGVDHPSGSAAACGWRQLVTQALFGSDRKYVVVGKRGSVRVTPGG